MTIAVTVVKCPVLTSPRCRMTIALEATVASVPSPYTEPQQASADYARPRLGGIENVRRAIVPRIGRGRFTIGRERGYHSDRGYWTVGVPLPRENCLAGPFGTADSPKMHIALVHHHVGGKAGGGGGVRLMLELGIGLVRRGHRVTVACHDFLPGSEFSYASDQLEIRSVRRGAFELPAGNRALARRFWLEMPKVARLVPPDAAVVNAHEWLALRPGRIAAGRLSIPLVWTRNDESPWESLLVPRQAITGDRPLLVRAAQAMLTWPDALDARRADAIAVLSAQQVEMVRRSYRKDASWCPSDRRLTSSIHRTGRLLAPGWASQRTCSWS